MTVFKKQIEIKTEQGKPSFKNITPSVKKAIDKSGVENGICTVISPHTTCSVFFEEYSHDIDENGNEYLQNDLNNVLKKIVPDHDSEEHYKYPGKEHFEAVASWPNAEKYLPNNDPSDLFNGDAHIKSTIIGSSETLEVDEGELGVGTTGYVYFVDFDQTRARERKCKIVIIGE